MSRIEALESKLEVLRAAVRDILDDAMETEQGPRRDHIMLLLMLTVNRAVQYETSQPVKDDMFSVPALEILAEMTVRSLGSVMDTSFDVMDRHVVMIDRDTGEVIQ